MAVSQEVLHVPTPEESAMAPQVFRYSRLRFFRVALSIAWSAFAHPFSSTVIDLATGQVHHENGEEKE
jgi:hypothetical protein